MARGQALDCEQLARLGEALEQEPEGASVEFLKPERVQDPAPTAAAGFKCN